MFEFIFSFFRLQCKTFRVSQVFSPTEISNLVPFVTKRGTNTEKLQEVLCLSFDIFILKNLKFIDDFRYIQTKNVHLSQKRKFDDKNLEAEQGLF
jgi:hypothetical protein